MNNDIKEILDYYKKDNEKYEKSMLSQFNEEQLETTFHESYQRYKNHKVLLDCINNLQEEVKSANESITWWTNRFNALYKENERIHKELDYANNDNIYYIAKIDKAIEYIYKLQRNDDIEIWRENGYWAYLLNILQGSEKE